MPSFSNPITTSKANNFLSSKAEINGSVNYAYETGNEFNKQKSHPNGEYLNYFFDNYRNNNHNNYSYNNGLAANASAITEVDIVQKSFNNRISSELNGASDKLVQNSNSNFQYLSNPLAYLFIILLY